MSSFWLPMGKGLIISVNWVDIGWKSPYHNMLFSRKRQYLCFVPFDLCFSPFIKPNSHFLTFYMHLSLICDKIGCEGYYAPICFGIWKLEVGDKSWTLKVKACVSYILTCVSHLLLNSFFIISLPHFSCLYLSLVGRYINFSLDVGG
jgi:hypothetical protein